MRPRKRQREDGYSQFETPASLGSASGGSRAHHFAHNDRKRWPKTLQRSCTAVRHYGETANCTLRGRGTKPDTCAILQQYANEGGISTRADGARTAKGVSSNQFCHWSETLVRFVSSSPAALLPPVPLEALMYLVQLRVHVDVPKCARMPHQKITCTTRTARVQQTFPTSSVPSPRPSTPTDGRTPMDLSTRAAPPTPQDTAQRCLPQRQD